MELPRIYFFCLNSPPHGHRVAASSTARPRAVSLSPHDHRASPSSTVRWACVNPLPHGHRAAASSCRCQELVRVATVRHSDIFAKTKRRELQLHIRSGKVVCYTSSQLYFSTEPSVCHPYGIKFTSSWLHGLIMFVIQEFVMNFK